MVGSVYIKNCWVLKVILKTTPTSLQSKQTDKKYPKDMKPVKRSRWAFQEEPGRGEATKSLRAHGKSCKNRLVGERVNRSIKVNTEVRHIKKQICFFLLSSTVYLCHLLSKIHFSGRYVFNHHWLNLIFCVFLEFFLSKFRLPVCSRWGHVRCNLLCCYV